METDVSLVRILYIYVGINVKFKEPYFPWKMNNLLEIDLYRLMRVEYSLAPISMGF